MIEECNIISVVLHTQILKKSVLKSASPRIPLKAQWQEKKEEIRLSPMAKAHTPTEKSKKQRDNNKNAIINFDYTTIADRRKTASSNKNSHPIGVVNSVYERSSIPLSAAVVYQKDKHLNICK